MTDDPVASASPHGNADDLVTVDAEIDTADDETVTVTRSAAFAEVARRPKQNAIEADDNLNDVEFYEKLRNLDGELDGSVRAQSQVATLSPGVTHPALEGDQEEMTATEETLLRDAEALLRELRIGTNELESMAEDIVTHGNHVLHVTYDEDQGGVQSLTPLPLASLTIVEDDMVQGGTVVYDTDDDDELSLSALMGNDDATTGQTVSSADWYVLNEGTDNEQLFPARDIIHLEYGRWGNWHTDLEGRQTFNVWGRRRLEPIKFALQAKANTLANKVAMDDKLLAREFYHIDVEALYGHIENDQRRTEKAQEYAEKLRTQLNDLDADEKPILPSEVEVEVKGPSGQKAIDMANFIEMMNNSIMHGMLFHVGSFGRDAGEGTLGGTRPAKEMSETNVRHLRSVLKEGFRELFRIHTLLGERESARTRVQSPDETLKGPEKYRLADDVTVPELTFDPISPRDQSDKVKDSVTAYQKGVVDLNEAREMLGHDPVTEDDIEDMLFKGNPAQDPMEETDSSRPIDDQNNPANDDERNSDDPGDNSSGSGDSAAETAGHDLRGHDEHPLHGEDSDDE